VGEEIAALQVSVAVLSERIESIASDRESDGQLASLDQRLEQVTRQVEASREQEGVTERLEVQLDDVGRRMDSLSEQVALLVTEARTQRQRDADRDAAAGPTGPAPGAKAAVEPSAEDPEPVAAMPISAPQAVPPAEAQPSAAQADIAAGADRPIPGDPPAASEGRQAAEPPASSTAPEGANDQPAANEVAAELPPAAAAPKASGDNRASSRRSRAARPVAQNPRAWEAELFGPADLDIPPDVLQDRLAEMAAVLKAEVTSLAEAATGTTGSGDRADGDGDPTTVADPVVSGLPSGNERTTVASENWFVNLIAVSREATALSLQATYREQGVEAAVVPIGRGLYGLRVFGFDSRPAAVTGAAEIKAALNIDEVWIGRK
jgi:hypothetical protein